jgi:hypothetical protein
MQLFTRFLMKAIELPILNINTGGLSGTLPKCEKDGS